MKGSQPNKLDLKETNSHLLQCSLQNVCWRSWPVMKFNENEQGSRCSTRTCINPPSSSCCCNAGSKVCFPSQQHQTVTGACLTCKTYRKSWSQAAHSNAHVDHFVCRYRNLRPESFPVMFHSFVGMARNRPPCPLRKTLTIALKVSVKSLEFRRSHTQHPATRVPTKEPKT